MAAAPIAAHVAMSNAAKPIIFFISSLSPLGLVARAGKEEGAISVRDSVEALEKPARLTKGNAPKVGASRASRTLA